VPLAKFAQQGEDHLLERSESVFQLLCANIALTSTTLLSGVRNVLNSRNSSSDHSP